MTKKDFFMGISSRDKDTEKDLMQPQRKSAPSHLDSVEAMPKKQEDTDSFRLWDPDLEPLEDQDEVFSTTFSYLKGKDSIDPKTMTTKL